MAFDEQGRFYLKPYQELYRPGRVSHEHLNHYMLGAVIFEDYFTWSDNHGEECEFKKSFYFRGKTKKDEKFTIYPTCYITDMLYIGINTYRYSVIHVDVDLEQCSDKEDANRYWRDEYYFRNEAMTPIPNITVPSGKGYHAFWFLKTPIPGKSMMHGSKMFSWYTDIRNNLCSALDGDYHAPINQGARNPMFWNDNPQYDIGFVAHYFHEKPFDLNELHIKRRLGKRKPPRIWGGVEYVKGSRNRATFEFALRTFTDNNLLSEHELLDIVLTFQAQSGEEPLPIGENRVIVSSVMSEKYHGVADRNYGAMELPQEDYSNMDSDERKRTIKNRQALGGMFSASLRKKKTAEKLVEVYNELKLSNPKVTQKVLAESSGISIRTVKNHWKDVLEKVQFS